MKKIFLLFVFSFLSLNSFGQEKKTQLTEQLDWMPVKNAAGLMGFINSKGEEFVPCKYTKIDKFVTFGDSKEKWAMVTDDQGLVGIINSIGKEVVPCKYVSIELFGEFEKNWARVTNDEGLIGFINSKGEEIVPCKYVKD
ncbi:WG repeat-containing protein [Flavobacterium gilvum]|uniref:WG repeat-containing protein n=1 Tax=Flavobacterium gilvum TaxID=1492737 RepID=A0AAC9I1T3_9FLAO|nr:WG repeat-containing protein [Flavobacterium gilvum]AOW08491.1 hypothetical protein EM308_02695 [Flavobacterium gilvum]